MPFSHHLPFPFGLLIHGLAVQISQILHPDVVQPSGGEQQEDLIRPKTGGLIVRQQVSADLIKQVNNSAGLLECPAP